MKSLQHDEGNNNISLCICFTHVLKDGTVSKDRPSLGHGTKSICPENTMDILKTAALYNPRAEM